MNTWDPEAPGASAGEVTGAGGRWRALTAGLVVVVVLVVAGTVVLTKGDDATPDLGHLDLPDEWDPLLADLVAFVEDERGAPFLHPVHVDLLDDAAYLASLTADAIEDTPHDSDQTQHGELDRWAAELRALGLLEGDWRDTDDLPEVVSGGHYVIPERRIRVRGVELSSAIQLVVVHELTHAWQDQHFDLMSLRETNDRDAAGAVLGLIEGDARRIEQRYLERVLVARLDAALDDDEAGGIGGGASGDAGDAGSITDVSWVLHEVAPYVLGQGFVDLLEARGGPAAVDAAFADPPSTEAELHRPGTHLSPSLVVHRTPALGIPDAELTEPPTSLGATLWLTLLAERLEPFAAVTAVDGWAGDTYATFERDGRACVRAVFAGVDAAAATAMADLLDRWATAMPSETGARSLEVLGDPGFESCDPGPRTPMQLTGGSVEALHLVGSRATCQAVAHRAPGGGRALRCEDESYLRGFVAAGGPGDLRLFCADVGDSLERRTDVDEAHDEGRLRDVPRLMLDAAQALDAVDPPEELAEAWQGYVDSTRVAARQLAQLRVGGDPPTFLPATAHQAEQVDGAVEDWLVQEEAMLEQVGASCGWRKES